MKNIIQKAWNKIPAVIRAILTGIVILIIGDLPLYFLVSKNVEILPGIPWVPVIGLIYLWIFWKFFSGRSGIFKTSETRKDLSRTNSLLAGTKRQVVFTGITLTVTLLSFTFLGYMLTEVPLNQVEILTALNSIPLWTSLSLILLVAVISGVVEETAFRGYMQRIIEKRHPAIVAIIIVAVMFTLAHSLPYILWPLFITGSIGWGYLAYYSDSIYPGIICHSIIDFSGFVWGMNNIEKLKEILQYDVFNSGPDNLFITLSAIAVISGILTIYSLAKLKNKMKVSYIQTL